MAEINNGSELNETGKYKYETVQETYRVEHLEFRPDADVQDSPDYNSLVKNNAHPIRHGKIRRTNIW